jgi:hypothetical protein
MSVSGITAQPLTPVDIQKKSAGTEQKAGFGFGDILDMVNPLQHLPGVSTVYRSVTGDEISPAAQLVGGVIFGGPIGIAASAGNLVLDAATGADAGEHVMAVFDEMTTPGPATDALYAGPQHTKLNGDNGEALLEHLMTGVYAATVAEATQPQKAVKAEKPQPQLAAYRDPAMGLTEADKQRQYKSDKLDQIAIDMKS